MLDLNHFNLRVVLQGQACLRDGVGPVRRMELKEEREGVGDVRSCYQ